MTGKDLLPSVEIAPVNAPPIERRPPAGVEGEMCRVQAIRRRRAGYALVDAVTALAILATTISMALTAVDKAQKLARAALDAREARALIERLLALPLPTPGPVSGQSPRWIWTLDLQPEPVLADQRISPCVRTVQVRDGASGRQYQAATLEPCPALKLQ